MIETVEKDTEESEDVNNILELIVPVGGFPSSCKLFGFNACQRNFDGWVKQPSPCCAAASLAGAWNSLLNIHRKSSLALDHNHVLAVYRTLLLEQINKSQKSFERKVGGSFFPLLRALEQDLTLQHRNIRGKGLNGVNKSAIVKSIKKMINVHITKKEDLSELSQVADDQNRIEEPLHCVLSSIQRFIQEESEINPSNQLNKISGDRIVDDEEDSEEDKADDDDDGDLRGPVTTSSAQGCTPRPNQQPRLHNNDDSLTQRTASELAEDDLHFPNPDATIRPPSQFQSVVSAAFPPNFWKSELYDLIKKVAGLRKLCHPRISTISEVLGSKSEVSLSVSARLFMGQKTTAKVRVDFPLLKKERHDERVIRQHWSALRAELANPDSVLLFHLKNHYALIFACREWVEVRGGGVSAEEGEVTGGGGRTSCMGAGTTRHVMQVLTARRGQRPSVWIDFEEVRDVMYGWKGYKIMAIHNRGGGRVVVRGEERPSADEGDRDRGDGQAEPGWGESLVQAMEERQRELQVFQYLGTDDGSD